METNLTAEQQKGIELAREGRNIFITGPGGVGKSFMLKQLTDELEAMGKTVYVTASTGIAAVNIGGRTLHAWAGVGIADKPLDILVAELKFRKSKLRWETDVLIIDEISMVHASFFDVINEIAKKLRYRAQPFGGIQIIACGDFFQLPPVARDEAVKPYVFRSKAWLEGNFEWIVLDQIFRQQDQVFIGALMEVRTGKLSPETLKLLEDRVDAELDVTDGITPTQLYPVNASADAINKKELDSLPGESYKYSHKQTFTKLSANERKSVGERIAKDCPVPPIVELKLGAQVMLAVNLLVEVGLCNGSRGVVIGFTEPAKHEIKPLAYPIVRFVNGKELPIKYFPWKFKSPEGWTVMHEQIPLRLAWALTIHKCIAGDSLVVTKNGLIRIDSFANQPVGTESELVIPVMGVVGWTKTSKFFKGREELYTLVTALGYKIQGSAQHPILTESWKSLSEIKIGDSVCLSVGWAVGKHSTDEVHSALCLGEIMKEVVKSEQLPAALLSSCPKAQQAFLSTILSDGEFRTENSSVAHQIQMMCANIGIIARVSYDGSWLIQSPPIECQGDEEIQVPLTRFTDQVVSIQKGDEALVYDFTVPDGESFVAGGFFNHNSQGLTLEKACIDMNVFELGHGYVGLSRVKSLEGLSIKNFHPYRIRADPEVIRLYSEHRK